MKILSVNKFFYHKGGSETYYFSLNKLLEANGHEVIPFSMKDVKNYPSSYEKYFIENVNYKIKSLTKKIKYSAKLIYSFESKKKIGKLINDTCPDIAHLNLFHHQMTPSILKQLKKNGIPIVHTVHDLKLLCPNYKMLSSNKICEKCKGGKYYNCLFEKCMKNSMFASLLSTIEMYVHYFLKSHNYIDVLITPSKYFKNKFIEYGYDENKIEHLYNFVDIDNFVPEYKSEDYFIYLGRLSDEKGILTLIKAMKNVKGSNLFVVGEGDKRSEIEQVISTFKIKNVKLLGFQSGKNLKNIIQNAKFMVIPSECYENNPMAIIESMAYGKPVIGANIGGIPELIHNKKNGLIFEPKDSNDLAEKINSLLENPRLIIEMGNYARQCIEIKFDKDIYFKRLINIYNKLLGINSNG